MALTDPREAWERLERALEPPSTESLARREAAGRVLASELVATVDVPPSDVSAMDGYALAGTVAAGESKPVAGVVAAGDPPGAELPADQVLRIMTGAPVPDGTTAVVPVEATDRGSEEVRFTSASVDGAHIRRRGEILKAGDPLLRPGTHLTPGALSLLATHGVDRVDVFRRPSVSFLTTGDEIVPPEATPRPGQLRDSHTDFLLAAGSRIGVTPRALGIAPDDREALERSIRAGLDADVLLICGGVSQGEFDFVESVLDEVGCEVLFDAVDIQPGKPLVAARREGGWVFGMPGNPASVMVTFWLFVSPLLRRMMGHEDGYLHGLEAGRLAATAPGAKGRDRYLPADTSRVDGELIVTPVPPIGSHDQAAYARGTALLRIPARSPVREAGEPCEVLPF